MKELVAVDIGKQFFGSSDGPRNLTDVGSIISVVIQGAMGLAGIILLLLLLGGGIAIISAAGKSDPEQMAKGKKAISSALIGFIIVFAAYWIVQLIELWTGINILG